MIPASVYARVETELAAEPPHEALLRRAYDEVGQASKAAARARYVELRAAELTWGTTTTICLSPAPRIAPPAIAIQRKPLPCREGTIELIAVAVIASLAIATLYFWHIDRCFWWVLFGLTQILNLLLGYEVSVRGAFTPGNSRRRLYGYLIGFFATVLLIGGFVLAPTLARTSF